MLGSVTQLELSLFFFLQLPSTGTGRKLDTLLDNCAFLVSSPKWYQQIWFRRGITRFGYELFVTKSPNQIHLQQHKPLLFFRLARGSSQFWISKGKFPSKRKSLG